MLRCVGSYGEGQESTIAHIANWLLYTDQPTSVNSEGIKLSSSPVANSAESGILELSKAKKAV
jgi:hypothetical protein